MSCRCSDERLRMQFVIAASAPSLTLMLETPRRDSRSPPAKALVEVDHLGALLKADDDVEIRALAAAERDRFLDVIGDAGALSRSVEDDPYRKRLFAEDRLIGAGDGDEILEVHRIGLRRRAALGNDDDVEDQSLRVAAVFALGLGLAEQAVE